MDLVRQDFNPRICEAVGMPELYCKFPPLRNSYDICGRVTPEVIEMTSTCGRVLPSAAVCSILTPARWYRGRSRAVISAPLRAPGASTSTFRITPWYTPPPRILSSACPDTISVEESSATSAGNPEWFIHLFGLRETCKEDRCTSVSIL